MKLAGYNIYKANRFINKISSFTPEKKIEWQYNQKWVLARFHYKNNNFYNMKIKGHLPKYWEQLPIMRKKDYQIDINKLLTNGYTKKNTYIANTSGSSGHPFFYAKNKYAHAITWALTENRYKWHNLRLESKQARYFGSPLEHTGKYYELLKDLLMNRKKMLVFDLSDSILDRHLILFEKIKFKFIYGYTSALVLFARYLLSNNLILHSICPTLKCCITTSEVLTPEDRIILNSAFGVKIINEYGVSEAGGIIAFEDDNSNWILSTETQFIEIVDDDGKVVNDGKEGKVLITDLHNKAMPFLRYEVGDIGIINSTKNNGQSFLNKLTGRTNDIINLPSGKKSPGLTFYYISRSILESYGILKEFIIKQETLDTFVFEIVSSRDLSNSEIQTIQDKMDIYLEPGLKIKINRKNMINRPKSGKLKHFYSYIDEK